jgi:hypothetical protein
MVKIKMYHMTAYGDVVHGLCVCRERLREGNLHVGAHRNPGILTPQASVPYHAVLPFPYNNPRRQGTVKSLRAARPVGVGRRARAQQNTTTDAQQTIRSSLPTP